MQLDVIGYRYSAEELFVLMSLQGKDSVRAVPALHQPNREQFARGMEALEENDILENVGGRLLLDRIHGFLISNLCDCDRYFSIEKEDRILALCACPKMVMTVQTRDREHWVIRVAPDMEGILEEYNREMKRFREGGIIRMADGTEEEEQEEIKDHAALERKSKAAVQALKRSVQYFK